MGGLVESFLLSHQTGPQPLQTPLVSDFPHSSSEPGCVWLPIKVPGLAALSAEQLLLTAPTASLLQSLSRPEWIKQAKAVLSMCFLWGDGLRDRKSPFHPEMATPAGSGRESFSSGSFLVCSALSACFGIRGDKVFFQHTNPFCPCCICSF